MPGSALAAGITESLRNSHANIDSVTCGLPVSVIVCTRNRAQYLHTCFESLALQNCDTLFEVVVVDNGSTDNTAAVIQEWCRKDARFRTTREPRVGLSAAKNTGVRLARGRLLLFTDDDVVVDQHWIRTYVDFFGRRGEQSIIAGGPIVPIPHDLGAWPDWFDACALPDLGLLDYGVERPLGRQEYVWGANMAVPASNFSELGSWDESVGRRGETRGTFEDTEYQDRVRAAGGTTWFCPFAKVHHRWPRPDLTPSRVLRTAFTRGRNAFWKDVLIQKEAGVFAPRRDYVRCLVLLVRSLGAFTFWSLVFRSSWKQDHFVRTHGAAWSAGATMDLLRAGRESGRLSFAIGHASMFVLDSVLHVLRRREETEGLSADADAQPLR
jgi:GT2 family glycosyltransferase